MQYVLGVLGGSGLYQMPGMTGVEEITVETPFGATSDAIVRGTLGETVLLFLPRHGRGHVLSPSVVPYRANVWALKSLGATHVMSVSAVGSLREEITPGDVVIADQFIDRTRGRVCTFFDRDLAAHVSMADPVCPLMAAAITKSARYAGAVVHEGGTYLCIEGPRFSTRAESHLWRQWGASVVGMTNVPEVFLAREAELPYATLCLATDYDAWKPHEAVDVASVLEVLKRNVSLAQRVVAAVAGSLPDPSASPATGAMRGAVMTAPEKISDAARARLGLLLPRDF